MKEETLTKEKAIKAYAILMSLVAAGAYDERQSDGSYGEDGIEESIDNLNEWGYKQGLKFVGNKGNYTLEPMEPEEVGDMYTGLSSAIEDLQQENAAMQGMIRAFIKLARGDQSIEKANLIASANQLLAAQNLEPETGDSHPDTR